jgi:hypothetical protein
MPLSGGFDATIPKGQGDIVTPDNFLFCVEAKKRERWKFIELLTNSGELIKFWKQAKDQAAKASKLPLLVVARNLQPPVAIFVPSPGIEAHLKASKRCYIRWEREDACIIIWKAFLELPSKLVFGA